LSIVQNAFARSSGRDSKYLVPTSAKYCSFVSQTTLTPEVRDLVLFANRIGEVQPPPMVASMFRHLAHWPGSLAVTATLLFPLAERGRLQELRHNTIGSAGMLAAELVDHARDFPALPEPASRGRILGALDLFRTTLIAKMVPVGHLLIGALPAGEGRNSQSVGDGL
jgi:hypothetical protein